VRAARAVIVTAEEIVSPEQIRRDPNRVAIPGIVVATVCEARWGAHPSPVQGYYRRDHEAYADYHRVTKTREGYERGRRDWIVEAEAVPGPAGLVGARAHVWHARFEYEWSVGLSGESRWLMRPFVSGLAGFLSYDFKDYLARYPRRARRESQVPDLSLGFYDVVWAWSPSGIGVVVSSGLPERDILARGERAESRLRQQWERLLGADRPMETRRARATTGACITSNFTREEYC